MSIIIEIELNNNILDILHESLKIADNNNEVFNENSYSDINYKNSITKKELFKEENLINFKKAFCGNLSVYSYCDINGKWIFANKGKITLNLIEKHLRKEITLGSYYVYKQHDKEYCRYICYDYDLHPLILEDRIIIDNSKKIKSVNKFPIRLYDEKTKKINENIVFNNEKEVLDYYWSNSGIIVYEIIEQENEFIKKEKYRIEANELDKLKKLTKEIREFLINSCKIPETEICRELSGRGNHIWIFPKNLTTLKRAYNYSQYLNKKILQSFGIECETFPKQDKLLDKVGIGNFVKLPLSINRKTKTECVILDNFDYNNIKGFKIDETISKNEETLLESITIPTTPSKAKKESKLTIGSITSKKEEKLPKIFDVLLECHRDVLSHKIDYAKYYKDINKKYYKDTKGTKEFEYLKELFWQVWTKLELSHKFLYPYLKKQSHFNIAKTETQLKYDYHNYKLPLKTEDNPNGKFIKASWKKLYPDYVKKQSKKKKEKKEAYIYDSYKIADSILQTYTIKTLGSKRPDYCLYKNGFYERGQLTSIETIISNTLRELEIPYSLTKNYELLKLIANETYVNIKEFDKNEMVLNLSNGLLNLKTLELIPHTPKYLSFRRIPITYNPKAKCPKIRKFLKEIFHSKDIKYILEKVGLSLTPIMIFQDGTFLFGTGNNGKTTFYNLLRSLLESNNYSGVDLVKLDSFIFSQIENKLANIVSDIDSSQNINIQNYKIYVGNELVVYINRKFIEPYQIPPTAKMWYSCNTSFPQVPLDTDKGFWRKITIIECPFEFDNIESLNILEELITPEELSGFLNLAIRNLRTLLRRGRFSPRYTDWEFYKDFWLTKNNLFGQFVEETMLIGSQYYADKQETLKSMNTWLVGNGKTPITDKKLTSMIKGIPKYYHERLSIDRKQTWLYTGFSIKDDIKKIPDFYLNKRKKLKTKIIDDFQK